MPLPVFPWIRVLEWDININFDPIAFDSHSSDGVRDVNFANMAQARIRPNLKMLVGKVPSSEPAERQAISSATILLAS